MRISLADYGVGNLHSIKKALEKYGASVSVVSDMGELADAECIVFPGVGAFDSTMEKLQPYREEICGRLKAGVPALGICIGMQIQFGSSAEGRTSGMGFIGGRVIGLDAIMVPHMGWNAVITEDSIMEDIADWSFYFAHSYRGSPEDKKCVIGTTEYEGKTFPSFFRQNNFYGTQFHPEKSGESGLQFISNFIDFAEDLL